jgi:hypothetical protein
VNQNRILEDITLEDEESVVEWIGRKRDVDEDYFLAALDSAGETIADILVSGSPSPDFDTMLIFPLADRLSLVLRVAKLAELKARGGQACPRK